MVEGGLGKPALAAVELALGGEQAFAEERLGRLEPLVLDEAPRALQEHFLDQLRVGDEPHVPRTDAVVREAAVFAAQPGEEAERVAAHPEEPLEPELVGRPRRKGVPRSAELGCGRVVHRRSAFAPSTYTYFAAP